MVLQLRLHAPHAGGLGLIPGQGTRGLPGGSMGKESACNAGDTGLIPGSGRSLGEENGYPLQYSRLENPVDRGAWWATVHGGRKRVNIKISTLLGK